MRKSFLQQIASVHMSAQDAPATVTVSRNQAEMACISQWSGCRWFSSSKHAAYHFPALLIMVVFTATPTLGGGGLDPHPPERPRRADQKNGDSASTILLPSTKFSMLSSLNHSERHGQQQLSSWDIWWMEMRLWQKAHPWQGTGKYPARNTTPNGEIITNLWL